MPRYVLDVHYHGEGLSGWQAQEGVENTVQGILDKALTTVLRHPVESYGAGRTDAGVHGLQMPAHFDTPEPLHPAFHIAINAVLPSNIAVRNIYRATRENFHARYDAIFRKYRYQLVFQKSPTLYGLAWWHKRPLDVDRMNAAAKVLMEYDSFESFCKTNSNNKTYFCHIQEAEFRWEGDVLVFHVKADRFLRGMVRALVGTLADVGLGKMGEADLRDILEKKNRCEAGQSAPPWGLFLAEVGYRPGELMDWKSSHFR